MKQVCVFLVTLATASCTGRQTEPADWQTELEQLRRQEKILLQTNDSLLTVLAAKQTPPDNKGVLPVENALLNSSGLRRNKIPVAPAELAGYLQEKHPELIGAAGVLGGTMRFEEAIPLADQYVFASLSDGHIMAYSLYRYRATREGTVQWESVYTSPRED